MKKAVKRKREPNLCSVCGLPMSRYGKVHFKCQKVMPNVTPISHAATVAEARAREDALKALKPVTRCWSKGMGQQKLREMFPDMAGRI